jgi:nucleoid DNA-binding protein
MNKQEMIKAIATDTKLTQVDVAKVLTSLEEQTYSTLQKGEKVQLTGFVTIKPVPRAARKGYDPIKEVAMNIDPTVGVSAKPGEKLKTAVEGLKYEDFKKAEKAKK